MCSSHPHSPSSSPAIADSGAAALAPDAQLLQDLVTANHILFNQGVLDAFGHVSVRHDKDPERYLLCRNMAPGLVSEADIIEFHLDGTPITAQGRRVYLERFIHGEIYRSRPDVMAVVHSHSPSVVPFSVAKKTPLRALCHMAGFIGTAAPVFEIRDTAGDGTDLLITNPGLGNALAQSLGDSSLILMRGHGSTVVAGTLKTAVYRAVYTEVNARTQLQAISLGELTYLSEAEAAATTRTIETQVERAWGLWAAAAQ